MEDAWDWVQDELKKIQDDMPADSEMMQVVDAISVADFWKRRYDEEQMLWERKLGIKEEEKSALQQQSQSHESAIKELHWKLKELENHWEKEKLLLEDRLKTKEVETALEKSKQLWETRLDSLEKENLSLKSQLGYVTGVDMSPARRDDQGVSSDAAIRIRQKEEALKEAEAKLKDRLEKLEQEKNDIAKTLKENEQVLATEREKWKKVEGELGGMSSKMTKRLEGLKEREQEHFVILEDLARGFAHRVRNYLGIMSGTIQLSVGTYKMESELEEQLKIVDQNIQEMLGSIEDFLKFARIPEMTIRQLDLNQLFDANIQVFENKFKIQNITVHKEFAPDLPVFSGDKPLLDEAIQNILQNSLEAMPEGGHLTVATGFDKASEVITVKITDTGGGISEAHIKKIYQPYFSTKKGRKGLSLTASKRIFNLHKGTLAIESTKGKGTTARIDFFIEPITSSDERSA